MKDGKIVPEKADLVRYIDCRYLEGYGPHHDRQRMKKKGVCTPTGGGIWCPSTVQSMLEHEKHCDDLLMQKHYVEDFLMHPCIKNKGALRQHFVKGDQASIAPKAVFYQA